MTLPFENDTRAVVKKIAARSLNASRKRNGFVITAVLIITFLLTLVLSAGNIFVSAQRQESLRLVGTTAEASLRNPTAEQKNILNQSQLVNHDLSGVIMGTTAAMVLSALTVYISCNKPVRMLSTMQPINTIHYDNFSDIKYRKICGFKNNVFHMAWRNLWRRRKNACMIILSFTVGCTAFLSISLFYESINPRQYVDSYYQYDIEVTDESEAGTNITKGILTQIKEMTGIEKLDVVERQFIFAEYDADIFQEYLADFQEKIKLDVDGLEPNIMSEQFWSYAYILPDEYISQKEPGTVYISKEYMEMFPLGTKFNIKNAQGSACIVHVVGYIEEEDDLPKGGMAPVIYLSETGRNNFGGEWNTFQIGIMCSTAQDGEVLKQLNTILPTGGIKIESKAEWEKKLSDNMSIFYLMLGGLALLIIKCGDDKETNSRNVDAGGRYLHSNYNKLSNFNLLYWSESIVWRYLQNSSLC